MDVWSEDERKRRLAIDKRKARPHATGAKAWTPGLWGLKANAGAPFVNTPTVAPASVAALIAGTPATVVADPQTAWASGQYVQTQTPGTPGRAYWSGTAWVAGIKP